MLSRAIYSYSRRLYSTLSSRAYLDYKHDRRDLEVAAKARRSTINLLKSTGHVMHQQFNVQQLYLLPTLYLCALYLSENKQRLVPLTS